MSLIVTCICGARLRAKPEAAGRRIKCPKCGQRIEVPAPAAPAKRDDAGPLDLLQQLTDGEGMSPEAPPAVTPARPIETVAYERDAAMARAALRGGSAKHDAISRPRRSFWGDLLFAFAYPVASTENGVNLAIITAISLAAPLCLQAGSVCCLLAFGALFVYGWKAAVFMNVVTDTAAGSDDLPGIKMEQGWFEDVIVPAFTYTATFLVSLSPAIVYGVVASSGLVNYNAIVHAVWAGFGAFMWPMVMLLFSMGVWRMIFRPDLVLVTLAQTILPYLAIWAALLAAVAIQILPALSGMLLRLGLSVPTYTASAIGFGYGIVTDVVGTYLMLVSMRLIGLYYLHFKQRFVFKLE